MEIEEHGGACCGIFHLHGFDEAAAEAYKLDLRTNMARFQADFRPQPRLLEVVLTTAQANNWHTPLIEAGFRRVLSFRNGNTGNNLFVYHWYNFANSRYEMYPPDGAAAVAPPNDPVQFVVNQRIEVLREDGLGFDIPIYGVVSHIGRSLIGVLQDAGNRRNYGPRRLRPVPYTVRAPGAPPVAPVAPPAPRQERRIIFSTYHCVYRDGRRGSGYDTPDAAIRANPRSIQIDRRNIYNDGTAAWLIGDPR